MAKDVAKKSTKAKSGFYGVFHSSANSWTAKVTVEGCRFIIGHFHNAVEAAKAYDAYLVHLIMVGDRREEDCLFNFPPKKACTVPAELQYAI